MAKSSAKPSRCCSDLGPDLPALLLWFHYVGDAKLLTAVQSLGTWREGNDGERGGGRRKRRRPAKEAE
ncbi:hypothetical protein L484_007717 [Morus notabilis]|uniref:Uncharacterized protein n=1 Tax=Morus notabilis TaxID=981085 RepID=W9S890_9ROSA|nr:hypothetical protein L484_007717 [Morus notabilis]